MPNLTIVPSDNMVYLNGEGLKIDCSHLPSYIHAVRWNGQASPPFGELEFVPDPAGRKAPNIRFSDLAPYAFLQDMWENERVRLYDEEQARIAAEAKTKA